MTMAWQTPYGRGFNTSFGYLGGGEDHFTQNGMKGEWGCSGIDLWNTLGPATKADNGRLPLQRRRGAYYRAAPRP